MPIRIRTRIWIGMKLDPGPPIQKTDIKPAFSLFGIYDKPSKGYDSKPCLSW